MLKFYLILGIFLLICASTIFADKLVYAADVTIHIDEEVLAKKLVSYFFDQLNRIKNIFFGELSHDIWNRITDLGAHVYEIGQHIFQQINSIVVHVLQLE